MIGGRSALLGAASGLGYGNWEGNYSDVSLLLRGNSVPGPPVLAPADESPNPVTITTTGATGISTTVFQYGDDSLFFPNNSSTATTAALSAFAFGSGDFTLEFWMRVSNPTWPFDFGLPFGIGNYGSGANISFAFSGSNFGIFNQAASGFSRSVGRGTDGVFHHVALCRSSSVTRFFYDGILIGTTDLTTQSFGNSVLYLNRVSEYSNSGIINGLHIDDLRITKGIARYTASYTPPSQLPANVTDDPSYNSVSLLLRGNTGPGPLVPADESPTPKAITVSGTAASTTVAGEWKYSGSALSFTKSSNSYLQAGTGNDPAFDFGSGDFTIEAWVRPSVVSGYNNVVSTMVGSFAAEGWIVYIHSGQLRFVTYDNSSNPTISISGGTITANTYTHMAVTRSGTTLRGFVNGAQAWSATISGNLITTNAMSKLLRVGRSGYAGSTDDYGGQIDDLRITKGIARYTKNFLPPPAQLPAI